MERKKYNFSFRIDPDVILCEVSGISLDINKMTEFFDILSDNGIAMGMILKDFSFHDQTGIISFITSNKNFALVSKLLEEFKVKVMISEFKVLANVVLFSFVAPDMKKFPGVAAILLDVFENLGIEPLLINSSEIKIMIVTDKKISDLLNEVEKNFIERWI